MDDILLPIRSSWSSSGVTIVSDGWTNTSRRPLINIIATSPKGAMFLKAEDCGRGKRIKMHNSLLMLL